MAKWFCSIKPGPDDPYAVILETEDDTPPLAEAVIEAAHAFDAKQFACVVLGRMARLSTDLSDDPTLIIKQTGDDAIADYSLRWTGSDYGQKPSRRMQVRRKGEDEWRDWRPTEAA